MLHFLFQSCFSFRIPLKNPKKCLNSVAGHGQALVLLSSYKDKIFDTIGNQNKWYNMEECSVLLPSAGSIVPRAIIHFLGGYIAGSVAPLAYDSTLTFLADAGYLIVVSPIPALETNHSNIAMSVAQKFTKCYKNELLRLMGDPQEALKVPIIGLSHSLGGKIMALMASRKEDRRKVPSRIGNIFLAFNNYGFQQSMDMSQAQAAQFDPKVKEAINAVNSPEIQNFVDMVADVSNVPSAVGDMLFGAFGNMAAAAVDTAGKRDPDGKGKSMNEEQRERFSKAVTARMRQAMGDQVDAVSQQVSKRITEALELEFDPSPEQTLSLIIDGYNIQSNALIRFSDDEIDQSHQLEAALKSRGGCDVDMTTLSGGHMTPISLVPGGSFAAGRDWEYSGIHSPRRKLLGNTEELKARGFLSDDQDDEGDDDDYGADGVDSRALAGLHKELLRQINRIIMEAEKPGTEYQLPGKVI